MVLGSDTALWNYPGGINPYDYRNHFSPALYTQTNQNAYQVMDPAFRGQFADSYGQPLKMTWWMLVGSVYGPGCGKARAVEKPQIHMPILDVQTGPGGGVGGRLGFGRFQLPAELEPVAAGEDGAVDGVVSGVAVVQAECSHGLEGFV